MKKQKSYLVEQLDWDVIEGPIEILLVKDPMVKTKNWTNREVIRPLGIRNLNTILQKIAKLKVILCRQIIFLSKFFTAETKIFIWETSDMYRQSPIFSLVTKNIL